VSNLNIEFARWNAEVEQEAAILIRKGVSPYEAVQTATKMVSERRRRKALEPQSEER
jgi:hypothetical protein